MAHGVYTRYVALGDSQTEGLWDGDDSDGIVGFADRLAAMLDALHPGLQYANLAIRGRRIRDVLDDQLPGALAMRPDLISVCVGMNDITRPGLLFDRALADLDLLHRAAGAVRCDRRDDHVPRHRAHRADRQVPDVADAAHERGDQRPRRIATGSSSSTSTTRRR